MGCSCEGDINKLLEPKNGRLVGGFSIARADGKIGGIRHHPAMIECEKINPRGKKSPVVVATFCPFCGVKYDVES